MLAYARRHSIVGTQHANERWRQNRRSADVSETTVYGPVGVLVMAVIQVVCIRAVSES